jgi:uncharacterized membrane protein (DUF4010 family)
LLATFRLALISVVLLPVLPDRGYGPWGAFNPYHIWWMVVLVAAISYVGYVATRLMGAERGILATGLFGGLASSTAVALSLARRAAESGSLPDTTAAGATIASTMMWPRIFLIVSAVDVGLAWRMLWPLAAAAVAASAGTAYFFWRARTAASEESGAAHDFAPNNPLDLAIAIRFGLILTVIMVVARAASAWAGGSGLLAVAALSGLVDVDAISLSVATMYTHQQITPAVAVGAILIAAGVNTVLKPALALAIDGTAFGLRFLLASLAMIAAGGAALLFVVSRV